MDPISRLGARRRISVFNTCLLISLVATWAQGQQTATCTPSNSWLDNVDGQSPCAVATALLLACAGVDSSSIPPLPTGQGSYSNDLPQCSCNTVMYNLYSACAYCQGGEPSDFRTWTQNCLSSSTPIAYMSFPNLSLGATVKTPLWAFTNVTSDGTFDLISIQDAVRPVSHKWSTIQILLPILVAGLTLLIGGLVAFFVFRRLRRGYNPIHDHSRTASADQLSSYTYSHHSHRSKRSISSTESKRSRPKQHAWEQANLKPSKKFGIFAPSIRKVRSTDRVAGWSITEENEGGTHSRALSASSLPLINEEPEVGPSNAASSSTASAVVNGDQSFLPLRRTKHGSPPRPAGDTNGNAKHVAPPPSTVPSTGALPLIRDSPDVNLSNSRPARGVGGARPPLVHIVSSPPSRGFHIDDTDSAKSPGAADQPAGDLRPVPHPLATTTTTAAAAAPRSENSVVLISRRPGENFTIPSSSMPVSPTSDDDWETVATSRESRVIQSRRWPAAFSDSSPILPESFTRSSGPSNAQAISSPEDDNEAMLPPSVRAAGYAPTAWQGRGSGSTSQPSSHSSAYTVPNPFTFNSRRENPLRGTFTQSTSANPNRKPFDIDE
ncbi:hypothetical protein SCHPADRAFT_938202 [Schizopora paradoxa]|uniref:Uncharacterized protein n=1 Tax=Schizopora paradoxa TaxID=27342 RepID=A0A0H2S2N2_9AGAM|nr:hypothetical protein SCHPADRAFT_938202 [Schizopora paradoxa]